MNIYDKLNENILKQIDKVKINDIKIEVIDNLLKCQLKHKANIAEALIVCGELSQTMVQIGEELLQKLNNTTERDKNEH